MIKNLITSFQIKYVTPNAVNWFKLISITGAAQFFVQAVGFASGILIIRLLPIQEYAYYTLANTMLGTMTILADGGISTGVMAQGGKVWQDKEKLGIVLATGLDLRRKFAIGSLVVSIPFLFYLLLYNGASILTASLIALAMIPAFFTALSDSLLEIVPKLHQNILPLQKNQVAVGTGRLALTAITMFVFPWAFIAVLAAGLPRIWGNIQLRKIVYGLADENQQPNNEIEIEILTLVKRIMPTSIYYCVSSQITIWLISIFGNSKSIAEVGVLGRLSMPLSFFSIITYIIVIPLYAKLQPKRELLLFRFLQITAILFLLICLFILGVYLFPLPILWLVGNEYNGLSTELLLSIIGSCIGLLSGILFHIYSSRGWALPPIIFILVNLFSIVICSSLFSLSTLKGVLYFNIALNMIALLQTIIFFLYKIFKVKN
jgi:O-antigen/teichoic acid export membrane protein